VTVPALDPEAVFIGAVLHLPAADAQQALSLLHADDLADPRLAVIADSARQLAALGIPPDPAAVLAHARAQGTVASADAVRSLSLLLADLWAGCPVPASWRFYAVAVLEEALRRRCTELATRIGQAAERESFASLLELVDVEARAVRELQERRAVAASPARTPLAAVSA
jgi:replicative DNA helicase